MKGFFRIFLILVVAFVAAQIVPYGRSHSNPVTLREPKWDSAATRTLAVRACFDCHSNQTDYRWYTNVAPFSWQMQRAIDKGRKVLNFTEWNRPQSATLNDVLRVLNDNKMPPWYYRGLDAESRLEPGERTVLRDGLVTVFETSPPGEPPKPEAAAASDG